MIFVTVGNDFRPFDRLLREADEIAPLIPCEMLIQTGTSNYQPKHASHFDFVPFETAIAYIRKSRMVVSHAGIGTIILCRQLGTPLIIVPRRKALGEHMNDHQMEIAMALEQRKTETVHILYEEGVLKEKILDLLGRSERSEPAAAPGRAHLVRMIRTFVEGSTEP